jgi:hypothetical protein
MDAEVSISQSAANSPTFVKPKLTMPIDSPRTSKQVLDHFRCGQEIPQFCVAEPLKGPKGYFRFGSSAICYGQATVEIHAAANGDLLDASPHVLDKGRTIVLPFDPNQVLEHLRYERYVSASESQGWIDAAWTKRLYYGLRPMLPVSIRRQLQKAYLLHRQDTAHFPRWPIDRSTDILLERLLALAIQSSKADRIPFIWFWPDGYKAAAIMTHDVETNAGWDFCGNLMDLDDAFGIKAAFQVVPEKRYEVHSAYLETIRNRGFEVNVHGLDHEGDLFKNRERFIECAKRINDYAVLFRSRGFRSPSLYRNADWFQELNFSYDMSVPNVAHLEAQRGGCCTVLPYFLPGGMLELPLTTTEDYSLFHILHDYSITLWKQQMSVILNGNGLLHFLVHPDYVIPDRARGVYKALLEEVSMLRDTRNVWVTLPGEVDRWWRERAQMRLISDGHNWRIEGAGRERARIAYASLDGDRLVYEVEAGTNSESGPSPSGRALTHSLAHVSLHQ